MARECRPHSITPRDDRTVAPLADGSHLQQLEEPGFLEGIPDFMRVCCADGVQPERDAMPQIQVDLQIDIVETDRTRRNVRGRRQETRSPPRTPALLETASHLGITEGQMKLFKEEADLEDAAHAIVVLRMAMLSQIAAVVVMVVYLMTGVLFYMYVEDWSFLDSFYFVVVTGAAHLPSLLHMS